ncbi:general substrate transporter [Plectosphaerella cucumerina]|uniref:General substrate transporter n=1 Tax=Plectosphaerella cucumerina TaxID=40658 RepID=A0A8K0TEX3_9PEZI|nr:general substrate transporter [Plectosphaerella cucumerina]
MHSTVADTAKVDDVEVSQLDTPDGGLAYPVDKPQDMTAITSAFANLTRGQSIRKFWRLYATVLMTSIGAMYAGYAASVIGSIIANEGFIRQFATVTDPDTGEPALASTHVSLWQAINFVSQIFIQLIAPITADRFGRKFNMWALTVFLTASIVFAIVARSWEVILASRIVSGLAGGLLGSSIMIYMSETAMPQFRGALLGSFSLFFAIGQLFLAVGLKILNDTSPMNYRNIFYSEFVMFALWLVPMFYLPESPVWYALNDRPEDAKKSLRRLIGNVEGYDVDHEYACIKYEADESSRLQRQHSDNDWRSFFSRTNLKRTIISTLPFTMQNFVGAPLFFNYATYFFQLARLDDPFLGNLIIQLVLVTGIVASFYLVDKSGRRNLVIYGGVFMSILCFIVGGLGFLTATSATGAALVTLCSLWAFTYAISVAPIGWISLVEISSPLFRAKSAAMASMIQGASGVVFNYTVPLMLSNQNAGWGQKIGLFFGGISVVYLIPVVLLYPETKGRTYQELDELFERGVKAWNFASTETSHQRSVNARLGSSE